MQNLDDDKRFENVRGLLKNLIKVKASSHFDSELMKRIRQTEEVKSKQSWLDKIFSPKLIPSAALAVTAVIILFLLKNNMNDIDDPFQSIPRLREDTSIMQSEPSAATDMGSLRDSRQKADKEELNSPAAVKSENQTDNYRGDSNVRKALTLDYTSLQRIEVRTLNYTPNEEIKSLGGLNYKIVLAGDEELQKLKSLHEKLIMETRNKENN
jgi:hypothetical protein